MSVFLVTGGAGFIGSHLTARLLAEGGRVRVLDNFSTGSLANLPTNEAPRGALEITRGDIRDLPTVERAAAPQLPNRENQEPAPISPYAVSKLAGEHYARVWHRLYGVETVGLRYFNGFGPGADPASEYAAVIPRFIARALRNEPLEVHGDGRQSRDFTYIDNVIEANILSGRAANVGGKVFNVGSGERLSLLDIVGRLEKILGRALQRRHTPSRAGDTAHTLADISKGEHWLGYTRLVSFDEGLARTVEYFRSRASPT